MGVEQKYYSRFAKWLASRQYAAVTFDYSGMGKSIIDSVTKCKFNVLDWARENGSAVLADVKEKYPSLENLLVRS